MTVVDVLVVLRLAILETFSDVEVLFVHRHCSVTRSVKSGTVPSSRLCQRRLDVEDVEGVVLVVGIVTTLPHGLA